MIIEVLSDGTAAYDRGAKFAAYRMLDSLQEYVLVDPERRSVEIFRRLPSNDWLLATGDSARPGAGGAGAGDRAGRGVRGRRRLKSRQQERRPRF